MIDIRQYLPTRDSSKSWQVLLVLMAVLILGIGAVGYQRVGQPRLRPSQPLPFTTPTPVKTPLLAPSPSTASLIYGTWENGSTIKAINADGSNQVTVANLPSNIKDVNIPQYFP